MSFLTWESDYFEQALPILFSSVTNFIEQSAIIRMIQNKFGNYVVQSIFTNSEERFKKKIYDFLLRVNKGLIDSVEYSKYVFANIEKYFCEGENNVISLIPLIKLSLATKYEN